MPRYMQVPIQNRGMPAPAIKGPARRDEREETEVKNARRHALSAHTHLPPPYPPVRSTPSPSTTSLVSVSLVRRILVCQIKTGCIVCVRMCACARGEVVGKGEKKRGGGNREGMKKEGGNALWTCAKCQPIRLGTEW